MLFDFVKLTAMLFDFVKLTASEKIQDSVEMLFVFVYSYFILGYQRVCIHEHENPREQLRNKMTTAEQNEDKQINSAGDTNHA
jgi:hypothetical protein